MIKTKNRTGNKALKLCAAFLFPFSLFGGAALIQSADAVNPASYVYYHEQEIPLTNSSFSEGGEPYASGNSLSGWNAIESASKATGMLINISGGSTSGSSSSNTFAKHQDTYMLKSNPGEKGNDNRILMINSKANSNNTQQAQKGYRSTELTLEANSFYRFSVSVKTDRNADDDVSASVYVSGLKDKDGKPFKIGYENLTNNIWKEYYIFIATGNEEQKVNIDLYLGSANGARSQGAVFFDEIFVNRYSENAFFDLCKNYNFTHDTYQSFDAKTVFLVEGLKQAANTVDTSDYNFDFEKPIDANSNTLGTDWSIVEKSNGHAVISEIRNMQPSDFFEMTGYSYIGDSLAYQNSQAMVLYTGNSTDYTSGYVGVQSKDIEIKAHGVYKITLKLKVAEVSEGSFFLQVQENDSIYSVYPTLISNDKEAKNYYELQKGKTSGITTNVENKFTNDYQTVELFVKGHSLYDTSANVQLWLGDKEAKANGCVIVDDISVEYATNEEFSSASNHIEFKSFKSEPSTVSNGFFNSTEIKTTELKYPVKASSWTSSIEKETNNESGVVYLYDNATYKTMYAGKYEWAGIFPGNPQNTISDTPNNVYMMFNKHNSYQSIKSSAYKLESDSYYQLSFDFYNQNGLGGVNPSNIKVEIVDENGISLFSQKNISSLGLWNKMNIYFHTPKAVSHNVQIIISLGDKEELVGGSVYLDNFVFSKSTQEAFDSNKQFSSDLTDYYFKLNPNNEIGRNVTSSPAYEQKVDEIKNSDYAENPEACATTGIVSGTDNPYRDSFPDLYVDDSNFLVITTHIASNASLTSKYTFNFESEKFYKVSFDLATIFNDSINTVDKDKTKYGVKVDIEGFDSISQLVSLNELKNYTIYLKCTETTNPKITFTLVSDCEEALGTALITHLDLTTIEEDVYNSASLDPKFEKSLFTTNQTSSTEDEKPEPEPDKPAEENKDNNSRWLVIPSIIMGVALLVGIIGYILKHIKIKKVEKIKNEVYDRKLSINHDEILAKAQERRDVEIKNLEKAKQTIVKQKDTLDEEHKSFIKENKEQANGKVSKLVEKEFREYSYQAARLEEKIDIIDEKIASTMSPDHLLTIERKIVAEEEENFKKEKKEWKLKNKVLKQNKKIESKKDKQSKKDSNKNT